MNNIKIFTEKQTRTISQFLVLSLVLCLGSCSLFDAHKMVDRRKPSIAAGRLVPGLGQFLYIASSNNDVSFTLEIDSAAGGPPIQPKATFTTSEGIFTSHAIQNLEGSMILRLFKPDGTLLGQATLCADTNRRWEESELLSNPADQTTGTGYWVTTNPTSDLVVIMDKNVTTTVD